MFVLAVFIFSVLLLLCFTHTVHDKKPLPTMPHDTMAQRAGAPRTAATST